MAPVVDKWQQISADIAELVSQSEVLRLVRDMGYLTVIREDAQKKYLLNLFHTMNAKQEREEGWKVAGIYLDGLDQFVQKAVHGPRTVPIATQAEAERTVEEYFGGLREAQLGDYKMWVRRLEMLLSKESVAKLTTQVWLEMIDTEELDCIAAPLDFAQP
ncbi:unnamed protein product [Symbiodinium natans]|uniref:Uncharacterized protein n=1 Tax=Symbiodinium natans TaxID=878477 RepID=A0A812LIK4_9DINO|nr:unnamed protein product [Symbiodinium natans]